MQITWRQLISILIQSVFATFIFTIALLPTILSDLAPKPTPEEISFAQVVANKPSFLNREIDTFSGDGKRHELTFVNGIVLYKDQDLYIVSGNPLPETITENDYIIIIGRNMPNNINIGDVISITRPKVETQIVESDGLRLDLFYISEFENAEVTDHITVNNYHQFSDIIYKVQDSNHPNLLLSWWLLTSPISPLSGISPLRPINIYPSYP